MKLRQDFITHELGGEQIVIDVSKKYFTGIIRGNETAAFIVDCLKTETTADEIVDKLQERYHEPRERLAADVEKILGQLRSVGAVE